MSDAWELSKENVLPVKRGRSAAMLSDVLGTRSIRKLDTLEQDRDLYFAEQLKQHQNNPLSLLTTYENQFKWYRDNFPSDSSRLIKLLERATCDLKDATTCANDTRFIKMWIEYADLVRTPGDIFAFMNSNKIGEKNALFWIAWSYVAEKANNFKLSDQIFQKGIKRLAEPKDLLQKRYQQFQRRLARHYINLAESEAAVEASVPVEEPSRRVLGTLSKSQVKSGQRTVNDENNAAFIPKPSTAPGGFNKKEKSNVSKPFEIYTDAAPIGDSSAALMENKNWKHLGTTHGHSKENAGMTTKWSDAPLKSSVVLEKKPDALPFTIFVDESLRDESADLANAEKPTRSTKPALSVRMEFDKVSLKSTADPLERHKLTTVPPPVFAEDTQGAVSSKVSGFTIYSDFIENVDGAVPIKPTASFATGMGFTIYNDFDPPSTAAAVNKLVSKTAVLTKAPAYSVTMDDEASKEQGAAGNRTVEAIELNNLLNEIGVYDHDDSTINTRLARKDIDEMFCSPDMKKSLASLNRSYVATAHTEAAKTRTLSIGDLSNIREESNDDYDRSIFGTIASPTFIDLKDDDKVSTRKKVARHPHDHISSCSSCSSSFVACFSAPFSSSFHRSPQHGDAPAPNNKNTASKITTAAGIFNPPPLLESLVSTRSKNGGSLLSSLSIFDEKGHKVEEVDTSPSIDESLGAEKQAGGGTRKAQQQERKDEELIASPDSDGLLKGHSKTKRYCTVDSLCSLLGSSMNAAAANMADRTQELQQLPTSKKCALDKKRALLFPLSLHLYIIDLDKATSALTLESTCTEEFYRDIIQTVPQRSSLLATASEVLPRFLRRTLNAKQAGTINLEFEGFTVHKVIGQGRFGTVYAADALASSFSIVDRNRSGSRRGGGGGGEGGHTAAAAVMPQTRSYVLKVDPDKVFVEWEVEIHELIRAAVGDDNILREYYAARYLPPTRLLLLQDAAVLIMPYATLGSLLNILRIRDKLSMTEIEFMTAHLAMQMLQSLLVLHSSGFLHTDIKPDNWVLRYSAAQQTVDLCLIDFGKARPLFLSIEKQIYRVSYRGSYAARGVYSVNTQQVWAYAVDLVGTAGCIFTLLYADELRVLSTTLDEARRAGYTAEDLAGHSPPYSLPKQTCKRYWDKRLWQTIFVELLNYTDVLGRRNEIYTSVLVMEALEARLAAFVEEKRGAHKGLFDRVRYYIEQLR